MKQKDPRQALYRRTARMIEKMLDDPRALTFEQRDWVHKIHETAQGYDELDGYTQRQCEVIADIYKAYTKGARTKARPDISQLESEGKIIRGMFASSSPEQ